MKALVTGVTRGIGRSLVEHLVADGWDVAAVARDEAALGALAAAWDGRVTPYAADVTDGPRLAEVAAQVGDLDLVVANAGALLGAGAVWESDPDSWWRGVEVNLRGVYLTLHAVLPRMIARGSGRIVVLASGIGTGPSPYDSGYGASKAAVLHLASTVEAELAGSGVHVFPVSPGMVRTDMTRFPDELTRHLPEMADIPDDRFTPVELRPPPGRRDRDGPARRARGAVRARPRRPRPAARGGRPRRSPAPHPAPGPGVARRSPRLAAIRICV